MITTFVKAEELPRDGVTYFLTYPDGSEIATENYDEAIELCDLIFSKNIDKIYFLRQYIKDSQVSYHQTLVKSKKFTI